MICGQQASAAGKGRRIWDKNADELFTGLTTPKNGLKRLCTCKTAKNGFWPKSWNRLFGNRYFGFVVYAWKSKKSRFFGHLSKIWRFWAKWNLEFLLDFLSLMVSFFVKKSRKSPHFRQKRWRIDHQIADPEKSPKTSMYIPQQERLFFICARLFFIYPRLFLIHQNSQPRLFFNTLRDCFLFHPDFKKEGGPPSLVDQIG